MKSFFFGSAPLKLERLCEIQGINLLQQSLNAT